MPFQMGASQGDFVARGQGVRLEAVRDPPGRFEDGFDEVGPCGWDGKGTEVGPGKGSTTFKGMAFGTANLGRKEEATPTVGIAPCGRGLDPRGSRGGAGSDLGVAILAEDELCRVAKFGFGGVREGVGEAEIMRGRHRAGHEGVGTQRGRPGRRTDEGLQGMGGIHSAGEAERPHGGVL